MSNEEEPAGTVQFLQYHRPGLTAGDYEIRIEQVVKITGHDSAIPPFKAEMNFTVAGERFELKPTDVHGVFPPDGNLGDHSNVFPHIILNRSTLPWERVAEMESTQATGVPWLALLLFNEDEKPKSKNLTLAALKEAGPEKFPPLTLEKGQQDKDEVTVIDVPAGRLKAIMPTTEELALLAHVRFGTEPVNPNRVDAADDKEKEEFAVIISNRLPQPGKTSFAHLVSVEKRFTQVGGKYVFDLQGAKDNDLIRLVSFKSWSFACTDEKKDFQQLLLRLNKTSGQPTHSSATLSLPHTTSADEALLSKGFVLLPHYFRHGDQTASWFHGPLIPGQNTSPKIDLPARAADELLRYDPALSMFDVSYAAAWQLGRLMALQDKTVSTGIYQWKRRRAQSAAQAKQWVHRLPFQKTTPAPELPQPLASWFDSLRNLEGVPFNYLVADERMLPPESIRFFRVDEAWLDCLADGARSIGRVASSDHAADQLQAKNSPAAGLGGPHTGFLLRSEVVSGWPGLLVEAFPDRKKSKGEQSLDVVRMERLGGGVLLCVFKGDIGRVEIYLKAETLHFGLHSDGSTYYKKLRKADSGEQLPDTPENTVKLDSSVHWREDSQRTLNVTVLAQSLKTSNSSQYALQMVEGAEKVIFRAR